jgi:hypothetical protein
MLAVIIIRRAQWFLINLPMIVAGFSEKVCGRDGVLSSKREANASQL